MLVSALTKRFFRISTFRQAPVSYQPLQSPQSKMAVPEVWSNRLFSTTTCCGVLNRVPLARLLRTILPANTTSGVQVRFSMPKPSRSLMPSSTGCLKRMRNSRARVAGARHPVATVAEKANLHSRTGAALVDLESLAVARVCRDHGRPFAVLRAVADPAERALPPAALAGLDEAGRI